MDSLLNKVKSSGYKLTKSREAIIKVLFDSNNKMLSVEEILKITKKNCNNINITTIYRNLNILESIGLIHKIISDNGVFLYKILCNDSHHHHLICNYCGKVESIDFCPLQNYINISNSKKFELTDHKLELYGLCENCIKKNAIKE